MFSCFRYYRCYPCEDNTLSTVGGRDEFLNYHMPSTAISTKQKITRNRVKIQTRHCSFDLSHRITEPCYLRHGRTWQLSPCFVETWVFHFLIISLEAPLFCTVVGVYAIVYTTVVRKENVSHEWNTLRKRFRIRFSGGHPSICSWSSMIVYAYTLSAMAKSNTKIISDSNSYPRGRLTIS